MSSSAERRTRGRVLREREPNAFPMASVVAPSGTVIEYPVPGTRSEAATFENRLSAARSAGYEQGRVDATSDAELVAELRRADAVHEVATSIAAACKTVANNRHAVVAEVIDESIDLVFELLQLLRGCVEGGIEAETRAAIGRALALVPGEGDLRIHLNPTTDLSAAEITSMVTTGSVHIVSDATVAPGGCIVEAGPCHIDAQIAPALERVRAVLDELRSSSVGERA